MLGRGGFGFVYEAQDTLLGEQVAIKELIPALVGDALMLKRFLSEAKATMRLRHKRIVGTHNIFKEGDNYYIVMEIMPGGSLEARVKARGALPAGEAVRIAAQVCEGLACAHEEGVVHCDLKPANILFDGRGEAKVADFGIAHVPEQMLTRSWHTPAGFVAGTLPYMSPEQMDGVRDDPRVDVYAVGAVLYRMLTGTTYLEFDQRETPRAQVENVQRVCNEKARPPSAHNQAVPAWLDAVVLRALAKQPETRYPDAETLRAALLRKAPAVVPPSQSGMTRRSPGSPPPRAPRSGVQAQRAPRPRWLWLIMLAAVVLLVTVLAGVALLLGGSDSDGAETPVAGLPVTVSASVTEMPAHTAAWTSTTTPTLAITKTPTPTITPTPTPSPMPTATQQPTPMPTETPLPTATLTPCAAADALFAREWSAVRDRLGCAEGPHTNTWVGEQTFEHGWMYWRKDIDAIYAIYDGGKWEDYPDIWHEGEPAFSCPDENTPSQSPPTPQLGFGKIWCTVPAVRQNLGWATAAEDGFDTPLQHFERGVLLRARSWTWVLYDDGTWEWQ